METRTLEKQIEDIESLIKAANLDEQTKIQLNNQFTKIKEIAEENLTCPITFEFYSAYNQPFTILTKSTIQTVVSKSAVKDLKDLHIKEIQQATAQTQKTGNLTVYTPLDPLTQLPINGYEINKEKLELLTSIEAQLEKLEQEIIKLEMTQKFSYTEAGKIFTLQIAMPNSQEAAALANKMQNEWNLPVNVNDKIITILPSKGMGSCGIYQSRNIEKPEIAIAFKDQKDRNEFGKTLALSNNECVLMPAWGAGLNAVYFTQSLLKKVLPQTLVTNNSSTLFSSLVKPLQQEESNILLFKTNTDELAVQFPNEETAIHCLELLKVDKYKYKDKDILIPDVREQHPNTLFFPSYKAGGGEFTAIFPSAEMCHKFFDLIIAGKEKVKTNAFTRQNRAGDFVIHFCDKVFFEKDGKLSLTISDKLKVNETSSLKIGLMK